MNILWIWIGPIWNHLCLINWTCESSQFDTVIRSVKAKIENRKFEYLRWKIFLKDFLLWLRISLTT